MIVTTTKCAICGRSADFVIDDNATLLREATCVNCGASLRNSDTAEAVLNYINHRNITSEADALDSLSDISIDDFAILNTCSTGAIHKSLEKHSAYICSEYFDAVPVGEYSEGILNVDLSNIPFKDNSIDVIITEDVFEHIEHYKDALKEIYRTLKPGGVHIFTVPLHEGKDTISRKDKQNVYHGDPNPLSGSEGVIVYTDWGRDIADIIAGYGFECEAKKCHTFYEPSDITDVDADYDNYLANRSNLQNYFKYNSVVIIAKKPEAQGQTTNKAFDAIQAVKHVLNKKILLEKEEIHSLNDEIEARGKHNVELDKEFKDMLVEYDNRGRYIKDLEYTIEKKDEEIESRGKYIKDLEYTIEKKDEEIESRGKYIKDLEYTIGQKDADISNLKSDIGSLEQRIRKQEGDLSYLIGIRDEYEHFKGTKAYKIAHGLQKTYDGILPPDSNRRFALRIIFNCVKRPALMKRALTKEHINQIKALNKQFGIHRATDYYTDLVASTKLEMEQEKMSYSKLTLPKCEEPLVSIVIPVYNQFYYTYKCLKSIIDNTGDVPYEVIIADDCSVDRTQDIQSLVENIVVVRTTENLRFLKNCNNAAIHARGQYIFFLNNDTEVKENWLKPLLQVFDTHPDAGMAGSKLIYPDGTLQEAGGIVWKDGSAWNYGHGMDPADPEFNYLKEVDYISGAAIMIKKSLWKEIGGFDTRFAPAYYEDTDLAFEVRKHGYKVYLQPLSVIVHYEGKSNGTSTATGLKASQVDNQKKFFEKWEEVLAKENFPNGQDVYLAKDRGQLRKQILVVDHYVPNYDKDAGGRCTYMYIKTFLKLGMKVTFIGDNFAKPEPYTTELNQYGVEVLYGNYYFNNWQNWLKDNLHYFDYVYLQRPHISIKYIDIVKKYARGKIFYFAHDLHHVRVQREYEITKDPQLLGEVEKWTRIEMELFDKADVGHVVGSFEQGVMQERFPDKPIRNIPLYIYDSFPEGIEKDFSKRKDYMFVGGFGHDPNIDAVLWFAKEIFPKIHKKYPDAVWHIIGNKAPDSVKAIVQPGIKLDGFVTDEELEQLYRSCRLVVAPLRFGAGVKGKLVEAAYYQTPMVTTSIGGEGLDNTMDAFFMEDDPDKMAQLIIDLYEDYDRLRAMSDHQKEFVEKYFSLEAAKRVLEQDL